jgi:hypothetical protein
VSEQTERETKPLSERMGPEREGEPSAAELVKPRLSLLAGALLLTIVAIAAGILLGGAYVIAVLVLAVLGWLFYAGYRLLGARGVGFDDRTAVGDTEQQPDVAHSEPRSTGAR